MWIRSVKLGKVLGLLILLSIISYFAFERMREARWQSAYTTGMRDLKEGRFADAEKHSKAAMTAAQSFGDHDPRLAVCLSGLATVYGNQARDADALPLLQRALAIREKKLGPDHPDVARSLNDLAWLSCNEGQYADADNAAGRL